MNSHLSHHRRKAKVGDASAGPSNALNQRKIRHRCIKVTQKGAIPDPRSGAAGVVVQDKLYLFGGYGGLGRKNDFLSFDFNTREWTLIEDDTGEGPGPRENNGVLVHEGSIYLFGGYNGTEWLNDFYKYDTLTNHWERIPERGTCPSPRFGYVSTHDKNYFYIFGGYDGTSWVNDMFRYSFSDGTWSEVTQIGSVPSARSCPSWANHEDSVYIFGGYNGIYRMSDFFKFSFATLRWTKIEADGVAPTSRYFHTSCFLGDDFYVFGGYDGNERLNDMHVYNLSTGSWQPCLQESSDFPSGRSSLVTQVHGRSIYIFGGYNGERVMNDMYEIRVSTFCVPPSRLVADMRLLVNDAELSDVTFTVEGREVRAVKAHLAVRSKHFHALLYGGMRESNADSSKPIEIVDVPYEVFYKVIEFLYTGEVEPEDFQTCLALFVASERFMLDRLKAICEEFIRSSIEVENVVEAFVCAHRHNAVELKQVSLEFILNNFCAVKDTKDFLELKSEPDLMMEILLQRH